MRDWLGMGFKALFAASLYLLLVVTPARAQSYYDWNQAGDPYIAAIGLQAGWATGSGLSVRWPLLPQTMMSVTGGIWRNDKSTDWNLGAELHLVLRQEGRVRLYAGPALAIIHDGEGGAEGDQHWNASIGVGVEYLLMPRLALKADLGFVYRRSHDDILPLPQGGLYFYF
ncbi:MAG TPA: hypothetical protein VKA63_01720 [Candidatus Krumholzibacteria bacterium]|nr:hypothetical protein [Candidatus Krumholzibacteria bacterium]